MPQSRLILYAHGSRDPRWRDTFETLERKLHADLGRDRVRLAYMEFATPDLFDVVAESVADGHRELRILPLFLAAGAHLSKDLPEQVEEARRRHPETAIEVLPPIGEHPRFTELIEDLIRETASDPARRRRSGES